ncbi:MAG TPA: M35 family metallo-endopeptidase [Myxococcaceae bacterium]|jgi:peptidyl-Lys metalloendopeptidase
MSKSLQVRSWLIGSIVGASLLGACGAPENERALQEEQATVGQELSGETAASRMSVTLSTERQTFSATNQALVTVTVRNDSQSKVKLLKWAVPDSELEEALFDVKLGGQSVQYLGAHFKRGPAKAEDYVQLKPGESLTRTVDLSTYYDLSKSGSYRITVDAKGLKSNTVEVFVEGRKSGPVEDAGPITTLGTLAFSKCDATQQATLQQAVSAGNTMAANSLNYLSTTAPSGTARYSTWFGAFSSGNWTTAKNHFTSIKDVFDTKTLTIDCGCKKTYYAYVYPNQPYKVYVCKAFWAAPMTGTDSKGGTLIHEISHFDAVAGTDDWAYGQTNAKSLASSDPSKALNNADNHEYFAENTPSLQ